ncbi:MULTISPECIES: hypothetical protein [Pimelobacter]|uniref:hypothetical protein n=1 Tax=Pimelobacter TaxID=2044 RepID=UPI001C05B164|nr:MULTISPECIES: hypothetical protein [Pimelobacter]MBU2698820.1 hypothetical protein [Pimelobacter sp. 30-1]UUW93010.1 hypothetical protein M0M43_30720 [Pimelobacter simplex]UUW99043.1 hypothetical protein M0M48_30740 [Pimelobacter simplex]
MPLAELEVLAPRVPASGAGTREELLASVLWEACAEAAVHNRENARATRAGALPSERLVARLLRRSHAEWHDYGTWLFTTYNRLAAGAPAEFIEQAWKSRHARLEHIKPRETPARRLP